MRTTVDFRDDLMIELQQRAARYRTSLKDEVNACLDKGLGSYDSSGPAWKAKTYAMGGEGITPGKVWELADSLEAEAYAAKRELRK
jgi:hypothetical protein